MKKVLFFLSLVLILLSLSCAGEAFSASSVSLEKEGEGYIFSFIPDKEGSYELILRSPDGTLEWSTSLSNSDPYMRSPDLLLTKGAMFPSGSYTYFIIDSEGREVSGEVSI